MATLLLTAVGTAIGGPIGGAIGAFIGQQADRALFGPGVREGPRLKELTVTTSSYGQTVARQFGRVRVAGSVIWATDLIETSEKQGGGKGRPSTRTYSYSSSFAVAVSSSPIAGLGRIWADGNLLRGAAGDLKTGGRLRIYKGQGDDPVDPLIAAAQGAATPAFRDFAYVVFEGLELADFGNRIPALTFEVFGTAENQVGIADLVPDAKIAGPRQNLEYARGFSDEGGSLLSSMTAIDRLYPLICVTKADGLEISQISSEFGSVPTLPHQLADQSAEGDKSRHKRRDVESAREPLAIRYYDEDRDYQPGVQRAIGTRTNGREAIADLPATMRADGARKLVNENSNRARWQHERIVWKTIELDPDIEPGAVVRLPNAPGSWLVESWEWYDGGVELGLIRIGPHLGANVASDGGTTIPPRDSFVGPTHLLAFEAPPERVNQDSGPQIFAAASSANAAWQGANLYLEQGAGLVPIGSADRERAIIGQLTSDLPASNATHFECSASVTLELVAADFALNDTDTAGIALGENRLMVGGEVIQFLSANYDGSGRWTISGLLRGRGGTENRAMAGQTAGTSVCLLDDRLTPLASSTTIASTARVAAIGLGDDEPVFASVENAGLSNRPPQPVHPKIESNDTGDWMFEWTRRARGVWVWEDEVDLPLVEDQESYLIGIGDTSLPLAAWTVSTANFALTASDRAALHASHGSEPIWVRQIGSYSNSPATYLANLA